MIRAERVSKSYGDTLVVDDVSLHLPAGGVTSIIGPNGAGKSTLLSMIARLMPMQAGTVTIDGLDVARTPSDVLARRLAVLRQDNHIAARLTVRDLVDFGRYPHSKGRLTPEDRRHIDEAIGYLNLTELEGRFLDGPNSEDVIGEISPEALEQILPTLASGMVPKMGACLKAVRGGVPRATVVDGREPHAVLLELFTNEGVGTQVLPGVETKTRKARDSQ